MKKFLMQYGLLAGLVLTFVGIFSLGGVYSRFMADQRLTHLEETTTTTTTDPSTQYSEYLALFAGADRAEEFAASEVLKTYTLFNRTQTFDPSVELSLRIFAGSQEVGVVYVINSFGKNAGLVVAYAIDVATDECVGILVEANSETPQYYATLNSAFFSQFDSLAFDDLALAVDSVAGATYSSKGFEMGLLYAREVYAADYGFVIPTVNLTLVSLDYNYDPATFVASPFIANIVYGDANTEATVYLSGSFDYVGLVGGGTDLDANLQAGLKTAASADGSVSSSCYFVEYDDTSRELVMGTKGYNSAEPIIVTIILTPTEDGIQSFEVDSHETYAEDANREYGTYTGGEVPAVEDYFLTQYQNTGLTEYDAIAGASQGTSPAMLALLSLLDGFITDLNGGN